MRIQEHTNIFTFATYYDHRTHKTEHSANGAIEFQTPLNQWAFAISVSNLRCLIDQPNVSSPVLIRVHARVSRGAIGIGIVTSDYQQYLSAEPQLSHNCDAASLDILLDDLESDPVLMVRNCAANGHSAGRITGIEVLSVDLERRPDHVLIHQMGKVGSVSIEQSIRNSDSHTSITRLHYLRNESIEKWREIGKPDVPQWEEATEYSRLDRELRESAKEVCVISGFRDPKEWMISTVFQNIESIFPNLKLTKQSLETDCNTIAQAINDSFHRYQNGSDHPSFSSSYIAIVIQLALIWFDIEFKGFHGVDIYQKTPNEDGIFVFELDKRRFIVYRFESLSANFDKILRLAGFPHAVSCRANSSCNKPYSHTWSAFKERFQPSAELESYLYDSKYYRFFYPASTACNRIPDAA